MYRTLLYLICFLAGFIANARTPREVPNVHVADASAWVSDPDGILSIQGRRQADYLLGQLQDSLTVEVPVVIVADLDGQDIDSYATELFELWGIGKKDRDNGMLVLISRDDRKAAIRTGYGTEGVINDGRAGRVIRQAIAPAMKEGDADSAVLNAVAMLGNYLQDPEAADYLYSSQRSNAQNDEEDFMEFLKGYGTLAIIAVAALILLSLYTYFSSRRLPDQERYRKLNNLRLVIFMAVPLTLGIGVISWGLWWFLRRHVRLHPHPCPNCGTLMHRVDEVHDNDYLTPAQDMEEKLNSVDYDVWLCPSCNETDIIPYVNSEANYSVCPNCGARADSLIARRVMRQPTTRAEGLGVNMFRCRNCGNTHEIPYRIAKVAQSPIIIIPSGGGGRGGIGGGFGGGGSFGGGMTGGGGASGGW